MGCCQCRCDEDEINLAHHVYYDTARSTSGQSPPSPQSDEPQTSTFAVHQSPPSPQSDEPQTSIFAVHQTITLLQDPLLKNLTFGDGRCACLHCITNEEANDTDIAIDEVHGLKPSELAAVLENEKNKDAVDHFGQYLVNGFYRGPIVAENVFVALQWLAVQYIHVRFEKHGKMISTK